MPTVRRVINPLAGLLLFVAVYTAYSAIMMYDGSVTSVEAETVFGFGFGLSLMWWTYRDRRQRQYPVPFEFEAFVYFAWFLVVPYYLFCTRGWRAMPLCIALIGSYSLPYLAALVVYEIVWQ